jgi:hypothetical protein
MKISFKLFSMLIPNNYDVFIQSVYARQEYPTFDELVGQHIHEKNQQLLCHGQKHEEVLFIRTNTLLKIVMRLTLTINDEGPAIIIVNKVIGCGNVLTKNLTSTSLKLTNVPN